MRSHSLFVENASVVLIASRRSGKTTLLKSILANDVLRYHKFEQKYMFTTVPGADGEYKGIFAPKEIIDFDLMTTVLPRIIKSNETKKHNILIVIEDPDTDKSISCINRLFTMARHVNIFIILVSQLPRKFCSPTIRSNADYVIMRNIGTEDLPNLRGMVRLATVETDEQLREIHKPTRDLSYKFLFVDNVAFKYMYLTKNGVVPNKK